FFTVFSARNRDVAISPLVWPAAISDMISDSRADSDLPPCSASTTSPRPMRPPPTRPEGDGPWLFVQSHCSATLILYRYTYTKSALLKPWQDSPGGCHRLCAGPARASAQAGSYAVPWREVVLSRLFGTGLSWARSLNSSVAFVLSQVTTEPALVLAKP